MNVLSADANPIERSGMTKAMPWNAIPELDRLTVYIFFWGILVSAVDR